MHSVIKCMATIQKRVTNVTYPDSDTQSHLYADFQNSWIWLNRPDKTLQIGHLIGKHVHLSSCMYSACQLSYSCLVLPPCWLLIICCITLCVQNKLVHLPDPDDYISLPEVSLFNSWWLQFVASVPSSTAVTVPVHGTLQFLLQGISTPAMASSDNTKPCISFPLTKDMLAVSMKLAPFIKEDLDG